MLHWRAPTICNSLHFLLLFAIVRLSGLFTAVKLVVIVILQSKTILKKIDGLYIPIMYGAA